MLHSMRAVLNLTTGKLIHYYTYTSPLGFHEWFLAIHCDGSDVPARVLAWKRKMTGQALKVGLGLAWVWPEPGLFGGHGG